MATDDYTPHGDHPPTRERRELRLLAERYVRDEADEEMIALVDELREDTEWWAHLWGPASAVAAARAGRGDALDLLRESIKAGFSQPELLEGELERYFATSADWPELEARMLANAPLPTLELIDWPDTAPYLPLELFVIPLSAPTISRRGCRAHSPAHGRPRRRCWSGYVGSGSTRTTTSTTRTRWRCSNGSTGESASPVSSTPSC